MPDSQHAGKIISDLVLSLVLAVHVINKLVECLNDSAHVNLVLCVHAFSQFVRHVTIDILTSRDQILFDASQRVMLLDIQVNNLVRYDTHSLQR